MKPPGENISDISKRNRSLDTTCTWQTTSIALILWGWNEIHQILLDSVRVRSIYFDFGAHYTWRIRESIDSVSVLPTIICYPLSRLCLFTGKYWPGFFLWIWVSTSRWTWQGCVYRHSLDQIFHMMRCG